VAQKCIINDATYTVLPAGSGLLAISGGRTNTVIKTGEDPITLASGAIATPLPGAGMTNLLTIDGEAVSRVSGGIVVGGRSVTRGGSAATISGTIYSVNTDEQQEML